MSKPAITVFGLGSGGIDDVTVGTLRGLARFNKLGWPLLLRTSRHPSVTDLTADGIEFYGSFDEIYDRAETFDGVYMEIVNRLISLAKAHDTIGYAVPGHPLFGEQTVRKLLSRVEDVDVTILSSTSFVDACLTTAREESDGLLVLDALSLPDPTNPFRSFASPFNVSLPTLIYQAYDSQIASRVKIALLELYPPDLEVSIVRAAGQPGEARTIRTPLHLLDRPSHDFDHLTTVLIPALRSAALTTQFDTLRDIMAQLRHPTKGCPWDREQTPQSLKRFAIEEVYEVVDAIDEGDIDHYVEELGDLLLQVVFHAQLAREAGEFTIDDVIKSISDKLLRRHPHVFGNVSVADATEVLANWEVIKRQEKGNVHRKSRLDGVPSHLPALSRALEISKKAAKAGFEWESIDGVFEKVEEEIDELKDAIQRGTQTDISSELGDLLFTVVNLARFARVDAEDSLRQMVRRFIKRFQWMEEQSERPLEGLNSAELESLWQAAKREQSSSES